MLSPVLKRKSWERACTDAAELARRFQEPYKVITTKVRGKERYHAAPKRPTWKRK